MLVDLQAVTPSRLSSFMTGKSSISLPRYQALAALQSEADLKFASLTDLHAAAARAQLKLRGYRELMQESSSTT